LARQRAFRGGECPFIEPLVFLSHTEVRLHLQGLAASKVCLRDQPATPGKPARPGILSAISRRECPGLPQRDLPAVNRPAIRAFAQAMEQAGITKTVAVKKRKGFTPEHIARLEQEMETLQRDFKAVETSYGQNVLHLTLARAYIRKLLENVNVARFLQSSQAEIHAEFAKLAAAEAL